MKKLLVSALAIILALAPLSGEAFAAAAGKIIEVPDIKIIIDGKLTPYADIPINIDGKNLLPLRELLASLGVENDDEHIRYDSEDKSVTIYKDETKIYMITGNKTAYVNDSPVELDVAPAFYVTDRGNGKTGKVYIPLAFVSEALGKKVVWNGPSRTVLISDEEKYNRIKEILDKSEEASEKISKYKMAVDMDCRTGTVQAGQVGNSTVWDGTGGDGVNVSMDVRADVDMSQKKMFMEMALDMFGVKIDTATYYADNASYTKTSDAQTWKKQTYEPEEYDRLFAERVSTGVPEYNELFYAGLDHVRSENPGEILLKGDVFLTELLSESLDTVESGFMPTEEDMDFDEFNTEISLDAETYLANSTVIRTKSTVEGKDGPVETEMVLKLLFPSKLQKKFILLSKGAVRPFCFFCMFFSALLID